MSSWWAVCVFGALVGLSRLAAADEPGVKDQEKPAEKPLALPFEEVDGMRCWDQGRFNPWIRAEVKTLRERGELVAKEKLLKGPMREKVSEPLPKVAAAEKELVPVEIADRLRASTVLVIALNAKGDDNFGTGFAVSGDLIVTNWHVFGLHPELPDVVAVDETGRVMPVTEVVAARPAEDLVVLRIRGKLTALPVAEKAPKQGENLWQMGQTHMALWSFSDGIVRRYCVESFVPDGADKSVEKVVMDVSNDVSKGSSGSAMVTNRGEVSGVYFRSRWYYQDESNRISAGDGNSLVLKDRYVLFSRSMCIPLKPLRSILGLDG